jgi:DNA-directed RNA polymerase subunit M/transcription elongation factor TFIIS
MEFCDVCDNMLYVRTDENKNLVKYCKHCDFSKTENNTGCIKISETIYTEDDLLYNQNINKYLRYDPTLRRINDALIKCPNKDCITKEDQEKQQQVLYIKYHPQNMKYLYVCDYCGHIWR